MKYLKTGLLLVAAMTAALHAEEEGGRANPDAADKNAYQWEKEKEKETPIETGEAASPRKGSRTTWGWEFGGVVTELPISNAIDSGFAVLMSHVYYSYYLGDSDDFFRTAASLGLYGFQIILPVPKASLDFYLGEPTQEIQFKGSVGGFYDITVGGHAGLALGMGILLKNRINFSFLAVPFGKDADRDYLEFIGQREVALPCTKDDPCVDMPYFGLFVGFQY